MSISNQDSTRLGLMLDCYNQAGAWVDGTVIEKHERETDLCYSRRRSMVCSPAFFTHLINTYDVLYSKEPSRFISSPDSKTSSDVDEVWYAFLENCGYGQSLSDFMRTAIKQATVLGAVMVVMDSDREQPASIDGMLKARSFPYMTVVLPQDWISLVVDLVGRITKFEYYYSKWDEENPGIRYSRVYENGSVTNKRYSKDDDGNEKVDIIDGPTPIYGGSLPIIPIVPSQEVLKTSSIPSSPVVGLYQLQKNIVNNLSLVDEGIIASQFALLKIKSDKTSGQLVIGANNALAIGPTDDADFIAPPSSPIDLMMRRVDSDIAMMVKTFANMLTSGEAQSGVAKLIDRQVGAMQLKTLAGYCQTIEYKVYEMFCAYVPMSYNENYTVEYFKDFDMSDISDYILEASSLLGIEFSDITKRAIKKDLIRKVFSGGDPSDTQALLESEDADQEEHDDENPDEVTESNDDNEPPQSNTALNGAQVSSLLEILANVKSNTIPKESASATIRAAFPAISPALVTEMLNGINPQAPVAPTPTV